METTIEEFMHANPDFAKEINERIEAYETAKEIVVVEIGLLTMTAQ